MTVALSYLPVQAFDNNNGLPLVGGQLFSYQAGTSTPAPTYTDSTGATPLPNPIILNARGEIATSTGASSGLWIPPSTAYKFVLQDALGNTIWTIDKVFAPLSNTSSLASSIIPSPSNTYTLGNSTNSWANVYVGDEAAPIFDPVSGNVGFYDETAAELAAGVTPTNFVYPSGHIFRYGADPTGASSSVIAINNAISVASSAANVSGGNVQVFVPPGTYLIDSTLQLKSNVKMTGGGITSVLNCTLAANSTYLMTGSGISNFHLEGMRFTGVISNNVNTQTTLLLFLNNGCNNGRVTRCFFDSCYIATGVDSATTPFSYNLEFSNNQVSNCALNGITINSTGYDFRVVENELFNIGVHVNLAPPGCAIQVRGVTGSVVANNVIRDCNNGTGGGLNGVDGIDMECITELGTVPTNLVSVTGNTIRNVSGYMIRMTETQNCTVSGNVLSGSSITGGGIVLGASHALGAAASGNTITGNGILNVTNNPAILVGGDSAGTPFITNNVISGNNTQGCLYGFYVTYAVDNIFSGNIAIGHSIGIYNTTGANDNVYIGNKTLNCTSNGIQIAAGTGNTVICSESHGNSAYGVIDQGTSTVFGLNNAYSNTTANYLLSGTTPKYDFTGLLVQAQTTGWGTPSGPGIINNYSGSAATLAQTSAVVSQILTILKTYGIISA